MKLKKNCKRQVNVKDKPSRSLNYFQKQNTLLKNIVCFALSGEVVLLHLPKVRNHPPLSFTWRALNKGGTLWVTTLGCSDVTALSRILALVRTLFVLKAVIRSMLACYSLPRWPPHHFTYSCLQSWSERGCLQPGSHRGSDLCLPRVSLLSKGILSAYLSCYLVP